MWFIGDEAGRGRCGQWLERLGEFGLVDELHVVVVAVDDVLAEAAHAARVLVLVLVETGVELALRLLAERVEVRLELARLEPQQALLVAQLGEYLQIGMDGLEHVVARVYVDEAVAVVGELLFAHAQVLRVQVLDM